MAKSSNKYRKYTEEELQLIQETSNERLADLAFILKRSIDSIRSKKWAMAHPKRSNEIKNKYKKKRYASMPDNAKGFYNLWTKAEEDLIMNSKCTDAELAMQMGRTEGSIQVKRARLMRQKKRRNK